MPWVCVKRLVGVRACCWLLWKATLSCLCAHTKVRLYDCTREHAGYIPNPTDHSPPPPPSPSSTSQTSAKWPQTIASARPSDTPYQPTTIPSKFCSPKTNAPPQLHERYRRSATLALRNGSGDSHRRYRVCCGHTLVQGWGCQGNDA